MNKSNSRGVQEISFQRRQELSADAFLARRAVNRVAHDRTSERGEMHANLVSSAGVQARLDERKVSEPHAQPPVRTCLAAFGAPCCHARAAAKVARNGQLDDSGFAL